MKYLIIILLSFFGLSASAQLMQTNGTAGGYQWVASKSDSLHIIPRGSDTPAIGGTKYGKSTVAAMFYKTTDSTLWIRSSNKWNQVTGSGGGSIVWGDITGDITNQIDLINYVDSVIVANGGTDSLYYRGGAAVDSFFYSKNGTEYFWYANPATDRIIYGGIVTWTGTDLDYYVTACYFRKNGIYYLTNDTTVTLPALADADSSRTDVFIVQTLSDTQAQTTSITGTESANPITPQVDGNTDLYLTQITLNPNQTTGLNDTLIVYDNLSAGEFEYRSSTGVTTNFSNTTNVWRVPYSVDVSAINNNDIIGFGTETQRNALDYLGLSFFIKLKAVMPNSNGMLVSLWNNGVQVSNEIGIPFNRTSLSYQGFSVPMTTFGMTNAYFDSVRFRYAGGGAGISGMYFDFIYFQGNMNPGGPSTGGNNKWVTQGTAITIDSLTTPNVYKISADTANTLSTKYYVDSVISASGVDSIVVNSPLSIDFTNRRIPVIGYTGDTTRYFVFESPIQATDLGDTVYVYLDSTGNGDYSVAHHSFGYYLGVFLTESQASIKYISYDSAIGKFMDTAYVRSDTLYGAKNGTEFPITTLGGGSGSGISQVVGDWGLININDSTLKVDSFLVASRARVDKVADSLGVIIAAKQAQLNGTGFVKATGTTITYDNSTYLTANQAVTVTATGDATGTSSASGTAPSLPLTLATINSNVGSFTNANITVNAKGLITAASSGSGGSGTVTSVGLSMPSAFSVSGSPVSTSGTLAVTGAGTTSQYIQGDGSLATKNWVVSDSIAIRYSGSALQHITSKNAKSNGGTAGGVNSDSANIFIGKNAGGASTMTGYFSVGIGVEALNGQTTSSHNTAVGFRALKLQAGSFGYNAAFGALALSANTTGTGNSAFGARTLTANTTSSENTAIGDQALYQATGGSNTGIGYAAGYNITGGSYNLAIGRQVMGQAFASTSGIGNTVVGNNVMVRATSADYNLIFSNFGNTATVSQLTQGDNNIFMLSQGGEDVITIGSRNMLFAAKSNSLNILAAGSNDNIHFINNSINRFGKWDNDTWYLNGTGSAITSVANASALLDMTSTDRGFLLPRQSTTQMNAISSPATGLKIYNTDLKREMWYDGTSWMGAVRIETGTAAPATTPLRVGDMFVDTSNKKSYQATGTSSSSDWTILN